MARKTDFIREARRQGKALLTALETLAALQAEWTAHGGAVWLVPEDFTAEQADVTKETVEAALAACGKLNTHAVNQGYKDLIYRIL